MEDANQEIKRHQNSKRQYLYFSNEWGDNKSRGIYSI